MYVLVFGIGEKIRGRFVYFELINQLALDAVGHPVCFVCGVLGHEKHSHIHSHAYSIQ